MEQLNKEFCVPYYIFEEIVDYVELTAKGYSKCMKWENIKSLLKLAVINDKLTMEQAKFIEKEFFREWNVTKILNFYDKFILIVIFLVKSKVLWYKLHK